MEYLLFMYKAVNTLLLCYLATLLLETNQDVCSENQSCLHRKSSFYYHTYAFALLNKIKFTLHVQKFFLSLQNEIFLNRTENTVLMNIILCTNPVTISL